MVLATSTNEIMVSGPGGNERAWTSRRLPEDKRWDAEASVGVRGSPSGTEFELKSIADPFNTETVDRPQPRPVLVRHEDIVQFGWSRNQVASTRRSVQNANIERACENS